MLLVNERICGEVLRHKKYELMVMCPNFRTVIAYNTLAYMPSKYTRYYARSGSKTCKTHKYVHRCTRSRQLSIRHISFIISIEVLSDWFCMKGSTYCGVYSTLSILSNILCSSFCLCYAFMYLSPFNRLKFFVFMGLWKDFFIYEIINFIIPPFFVSPKPRRRQGTWRLFLKS